MFLTLTKKLRELPDTWLICLTVLLLPVSTGLGLALSRTESLSLKTNDTEISLGEIRQVVKQNKNLVENLREQNQVVIDANKKAQQAISQKKAVLPQLAKVEEAIAVSENLATDLEQNNKQLLENIDQEESNK